MMAKHSICFQIYVLLVGCNLIVAQLNSQNCREGPCEVVESVTTTDPNHPPLYDVTILMGDAHFTNRRVNNSYVDLCLLPLTTQPEPNLSNCHRICKTRVVHGSTSQPPIRGYCDLLFQVYSPERMRLYNTDRLTLFFRSVHVGNERVDGLFTDTLGSIYERHGKKGEFRSRFALSSNGTQIGDIELRLNYQFRNLKH